MYNIDGQPLWKAETYNSWAARNFLNGLGFSNPIGPENPYNRALLTTSVPIATSFFILGVSEFAARLPAVIAGILTIVISYLFGRNIAGNKMGLIYAGMISLDFWLISWQSQARMYSQSVLLYISAIYLLYRWYDKDKLKFRSKYLFLGFLISLLGYHNHIAFLGIGPVFAVFIALSTIMIIDRHNIVSELSSNVFARRHFYWIIIGAITLYIFLKVHGIPFPLIEYVPEWYNEQRGYLYYIMWLRDNSSVPIFFFSMGLVLIWRKRENWLIPLAFLIPFIVQSTITPYKEPKLIIHLYVFYLMLAAVPIVYALNILESKIGSRFNSDIISICVIFVLLIALQTPFNTINQLEEDSHGMIGSKPNHQGPANYIMNRYSQKDLVFSSAPFITAWYMNGNAERIDYNLNPENNKRINGSVYSPTSGAKGIPNSTVMKNIMGENSGWVVADPNFRHSTDREIRKTIVRGSERIDQPNWTKVVLYRFE